MSNFSELVKFRNELTEDLQKLKTRFSIDEQLSTLDSLKKRNELVADQFPIDNYIKKYNELSSQHTGIIEEFTKEIDQLSAYIDELANSIFNTTEYQELMSKKNIHQTLLVNAQLKDIIITRCGSYCDFRFPGLLLFPREAQWLNSIIVANDPLYILQHDSVGIDELTSEFSNLYKSRLRIYQNINALPQKQFGFILFWDYLSYLSFDQFEQFFNQIFNLLKPGGTVLINYNNCDIWGSAKRAEMFDAAYCTSRMVADLAEQTGFEIIKFEDLDNGDPLNTHVSWVELRRPGTLTTVKAHQALATILSK